MVYTDISQKLLYTNYKTDIKVHAYVQMKIFIKKHAAINTAPMERPVLWSQFPVDAAGKVSQFDKRLSLYVSSILRTSCDAVLLAFVKMFSMLNKEIIKTAFDIKMTCQITINSFY